MKYYLIEIDEYFVWIYFRHGKDKNILEAQRRGIPLIGPYSYFKHPPHNPTGAYHLHIYCKQNELFSINKNGTAHDGSSGYRIPNKVANKLREMFPNWKIPDNNIIERRSFDFTKILIEILLRK